MPAAFRSYSEYLKQRYGAPAYRVSIDAGFSCPNRGPDRRRPGCLYCDEHGSRAPYLPPDRAIDATAGSLAEVEESIRTQIEGTIRFLRARYRAEHYLLYFQAFSNTFAAADRLRRIYDFALGCAPFRELLVSTRPDCIDGQIAALLGSYRSQAREVWVELGLQSGCDRTLERIRRGHTVQDFQKAYDTLRRHGLKLAVHLIFGLPGEGTAEILDTVRYVSSLRPDGVKIHNLHIPSGSPLSAEHLAGELAVPCDRRHLEYVVQALELLPPQTVIMRLASDTPKARLAAPLRFWPKARFYRELRRELARRQSWQGKRFAPLTGTASPPPGR